MWTTGRPDRFAISEPIDCPSGSEALTLIVIGAPSATVRLAGAVTTGRFSTVTEVLDEPDRALVAMKAMV